MSQAVTCPVCNGSGKYTPPNDGQTLVPGPQPCHGCGGKGWVTLDDGYAPPPYVPQPYVPPEPYPTWPPWRVPAHPPYSPWWYHTTYSDRTTGYGVGLNTSAAEFHQA